MGMCWYAGGRLCPREASMLVEELDLHRLSVSEASRQQDVLPRVLGLAAVWGSLNSWAGVGGGGGLKGCAGLGP